MNQNTDRNPVEVLADEFAARFRRGERPSVAEYTQKYPAHAEEIEDLFPSIVMMEQLKEKQETDRNAVERQRQFRGKRLERLGDYEIVQEIGRGGMGVVFEATQASLGRRVALKVLSDSATASEKHVQRFEREARAAAALHHTNIVPVFGVGHEEDLHFYVMQYIEGVGLDEILAALRLMAAEQVASTESRSAAVLANALRCGSFEGPRKIGGSSSLSLARETLDVLAEDETTRSGVLSGSIQDPTVPADATGSLVGHPVAAPAAAGKRAELPQAGSFGQRYFKSVARIGLQVADALQYAHGQDVLHRDIKPGNLLLDAQGTVWVTDFGLAKLTKQQDLTKTGDIVGTLRYMAPEQIDGKSDERSDIYSLGLSIYELLTLQPACDDKAIKELLEHRRSEPTPRPRSLNREIPADLETIVLKAISVEPQHRYLTAAELAEDFHRFLEDRPILARRATTLERVWRWSRRNPAMASLSSTALGLAVLVVVLLSIGMVRSERAFKREEGQRIAAEAASTQARINLDLAIQTFDKIIRNIGSRGAPLLYDLEALDEESTEDQVLHYETLVTPADAELLADLLAIFERFAEQNSADLGERSAQAYQHIGDIQQRLRRRDEAVTAYGQALKLYERLSAEEPENATFVVVQAEILNEIANTERLHGDPRRAGEIAGQARNLLIKQPSSLAADPRVRFALAQTYLQMAPRISVDILAFYEHRRNAERPAQVNNRGGGPPNRNRRFTEWITSRAGKAYAEAESLLVELRDDYPTNPNYRLALARCYLGQNRLAALNSEPIDCDKSIAILQKLISEYPQDPRYRYEMADALTLGCGAEPHGGHQISQLGEAVLIARELVRQFPSEPEYEDLLSRCLTEQGNELDRLQRLDDAANAFAEVTQLRRMMVDRYSGVMSYRIALWAALDRYARVLFDQERFAEWEQIQYEVESIDKTVEVRRPARGPRGRSQRNPRR